MIPTWDLAVSAIDEVHRMSVHESVGGLLVPLVGTPEWNSQEWEPLWRRFQETGKPVVMHQGTGHDMIFYQGGLGDHQPPHHAVDGASATRHPELRRRAGAPSRPPRRAGRGQCRMDGVDDVDARRVLPRGRDVGWTKPILAELPSHYLRRQVHATFQDDPMAIHNIPLTGTDCLMWGNDFPHPREHVPIWNKVLDALPEQQPRRGGPGGGFRRRLLRVRRQRPRTRGLTCSSVGQPALDREPLAEPESLRDLAVARFHPEGPRTRRASHRAPDRRSLDLVAERGSLEFTVQEVVARAQLSLQRAFYQLFEGKDALIEAVLEESLERGVLALRELVEEETSDRSPARGRDRVLRARHVEQAAHARFWSRVPDARAPHLSAVAPVKSWKTYRPLRVLAYELSRAAAAEHEVRSDLDIDRLAGFILLSVSAVTELAIDEPEQRWPDGEQLWQLVAEGRARGIRPS